VLTLSAAALSIGLGALTLAELFFPEGS
jgi:hypothetical protein